MEQNNTNTSKTYTQEEYDTAIGGIKKRFEKKFEKDYVSKETYEELKTERDELLRQNRQPKIEETYLKVGGKKEAFNDFLTLNNDLYDVQDKDLEKSIQDKQQKFSYMFDKVDKSVINPANVFDRAPQGSKLEEQFAIGQDHTGDLVLNKKNNFER